MKDFIACLQERKIYGIPANAQIMSIHDIRQDPNATPVESKTHCLSEYTVPKSSFNKVMSWDVEPKKFRQTGKARLIKFLKGETDENGNTEILHISLDKG